MESTQSTEQPAIAQVAGAIAGSSSTADTTANPVTSKRRRGSQSTSKTKPSPEERALKKKERALQQKQHDREFLIKYMAFMNRYQDFIEAKEELVKKYPDLGCS
jgi:hypothetical protein